MTFTYNCPWCNAKAEPWVEEGPMWWWECESPDCMARGPWATSKEEAAEKWNSVAQFFGSQAVTIKAKPEA